MGALARMGEMMRRCTATPRSAPAASETSAAAQMGQPNATEEVDGVHAQHDQVDVGDPHDVEHAEDQVQPEREQRQDAAQQDAVDRRLDEEDRVDMVARLSWRDRCDRVVVWVLHIRSLASAAAPRAPHTPMYALRTKSCSESSAARPSILMRPTSRQIRAVHQLEHLAHVLLDDEDGVALLAHAADQIEDAQHHHRGQAHRGLVEEDDLRLRHERAPDGQHLLLAARHAARALRLALGQDREAACRRARGSRGSGRGRGQEGAHLEVVGHGERGEEAAALGHVGDAVGHDVVGRWPASSAPSKASVPARGSDAAPEITRRSVVLPAPLGPTTATASPGATRRLTSQSAVKWP